MKGRIKTIAVAIAGIAVLKTVLPIMPMSYAASSAGSPDVITQELQSTTSEQETEKKKWSPWKWFKNEEGKTGDTVPIQRNDGKENQDELAGPLRDFHREVNRLFDQTFRDFGFSSFNINRPFFHTYGGMFRPVTDLAANDKEYTITVEVPGADKDDIKIEVANNVMTIRGEKKQKQEEEQKDFYRQERYYGSFQRVLSLPEDADQDDIKATFDQGVLTVTMPRKDMPKPNVKEIEIHSS